MSGSEPESESKLSSTASSRHVQSKSSAKFPVAMRSGETPVHIPNTMVKTCTAESTALETVWEVRWLPDQISSIISVITYLDNFTLIKTN